MKNITLSADEALIEAARARARAEKSTLNEQFRIWLAQYAQTQERIQSYDAAMKDLRGKMKLGVRRSRDAMNER